MSFLAVKLAGHSRYSHDDIWSLDRALGLFAQLTVLPKSATLSSYSYRVTRSVNRTFLKDLSRQGKRILLPPIFYLTTWYQEIHREIFSK